MQDIDLSVTICSWNTLPDLRVCLQSLEAARGEGSFEVVVIDNASGDGSAKMVAEEFDWVRLFALDQNLGFGRGHNYAFAQSDARLLMALNSDTIVHATAIEKIIRFMDSDASIGIVGPKLLNPEGTLQMSCRRFPTPVAALFRNTPLGKLFPNNRFTRDYLMSDWPHSEARDVDWVSGAALTMTRRLYNQNGGFDEQFFMYLEDVDICYRAHEKGYRVVYYPEAVVTHAIGRSTDRVANRMIRQFHKSMMLFYRKHYLPKTNALLRPFAILAAEAMLFTRQSIFIIKNHIDAHRRKRSAK
ncbi:MAG: glycosyltransferase family 2 protein [Armatimonadetes bacterium]|nr:glycosyltransferase family 2 protein [Armatimonadota bacterium]